MGKEKRRQMFVDWRVQGALVLQAFMQWCMYLLASFTLVTLWYAFSTGMNGGFVECVRAVWIRFAPVFCALLLLLPYAIWDTVQTSHRFVGPIHRLRKTLNQLARGEAVDELKFRDKDYWGSLADEFNQALARRPSAHASPAPVKDLS
jgi:hypothetical protein